MENLTNSPAQVTYSLTAHDFELITEKIKKEAFNEAISVMKAEIEKAKDKPIVTRKEAMSQLGISECTIISWGKRGLLRKIKHGHACYYYQDDIDKIVREGTEM